MNLVNLLLVVVNEVHRKTTVSEMELVAAIQALRSLPLGVRIELPGSSRDR